MTTGNRFAAAPRPRGTRSEKVEHRLVAAFYRALGCKVYSLAQGYRPGGKRHATTRQTKGLADLYVVPTRSSALPFWHEVKRMDGNRMVGKLTPEQVAFARVNAFAGIAVVVGGLDAAKEHAALVGMYVPPVTVA